MRLILALFPALVLFPAFAFASPVLTTKVDNIPDLCEPLAKALFWQIGYVVPDPVEEKKKDENAFTLQIRADILNVPWQRLGPADFRQREPELFDKFGLGEYDHSYTVYTYGHADFFGEPQSTGKQFESIYRLVHKRSELSPEIFMHDDKSAVATGVSQLRASDAFTYGTLTYLLVRLPKDVQVYEIDTANVSDSWDKKTFIPNMVCEFDMEEPASTKP